MDSMIVCVRWQSALESIKYMDIRDSAQLYRCQKCNRGGALRYLVHSLFIHGGIHSMIYFSIRIKVAGLCSSTCSDWDGAVTCFRHTVSMYSCYGYMWEYNQYGTGKADQWDIKCQYVFLCVCETTRDNSLWFITEYTLHIDLWISLYIVVELWRLK